MIQLSDYITSEGGEILNRMVATQAAMLALTGIANGYKVFQATNGVAYEFTGASPTQLADWTVIAEATYDCTAAIQAAFDEAKANGGGQIVFPKGLVIQAGDVNTNFDFGAPRVSVSGGGSTLMFKDIGYNRWYLVNVYQIVIEKMTFIGDPTRHFDSQDAHFILGAKQVAIRDCFFLGLATDAARGCIFVPGKLVAQNVSLSGSCASVAGVITATGFESCYLQQINAFDYHGAWDVNYGKNNLGNYAWIYAKNGYHWDGTDTQVNANNMNRLTVRECSLDEGSAVAIHAEDIRRVEISGVSNNASGTYGLARLIDIERAKVDQCWIGWGTDRYVALTAHNVDLLELDGFQCQTNGARRLELTGTTAKVTMKDTTLSPDVNYPDGINNVAGAEIVNLDDTATGSSSQGGFGYIRHISR